MIFYSFFTFHQEQLDLKQSHVHKNHDDDDGIHSCKHNPNTTHLNDDTTPTYTLEVNDITGKVVVKSNTQRNWILKKEKYFDSNTREFKPSTQTTGYQLDRNSIPIATGNKFKRTGCVKKKT